MEFELANRDTAGFLSLISDLMAVATEMGYEPTCDMGAMRSLNTIGAPDIQTLEDPMQVLSVVAYGDFAIDGLSTERTVVHITAMVAETAVTNAVPMMVGGDT